VVAACDPAAVERILVNVIDNAATHATGSDHIAASVRFGRRLEIRARDHGPGLAADVRDKLFVPFSRSAEAAAGAAPGVGLGLALCRRLARAQGGDLRLEQPDDGDVEAALKLPLG
jgi:signal transduction histidine kinase